LYLTGDQKARDMYLLLFVTIMPGDYDLLNGHLIIPSPQVEEEVVVNGLKR
jgi:hypothetical protein